MSTQRPRRRNNVNTSKAKLRKFLDENVFAEKSESEKILELIRQRHKDREEAFHSFQIDHNEKPDWAKSQTSLFIKNYNPTDNTPLQNSHKLFQLILARAALEEDLEERTILFEHFLSIICGHLSDTVSQQIYTAIDNLDD